MKHQKKALIIAGIIAMALIVAGAVYYFKHSNTAISNQNPSSTVSSRVWIMTGHALSEVTADSNARSAISADTFYATGFNPNSTNAAEKGLHIIPTKTYQSESKFASDVADNKIPSYVKAILYDNEPWSLTPIAEKQDPVAYYKQAYTLAHAHGYSFIATPVPNTLAPQIAAYADLVDVQAQYAQSSTTRYLSAVQSVIEQVAQNNPHVKIVSGLSTNPTAGDPSPQQLHDIAKATYPSLVSGWWLNIPSPGSACPKCNQPRPDIAIEFLKLLGPVT